MAAEPELQVAQEEELQQVALHGEWEAELQLPEMELGPQEAEPQGAREAEPQEVDAKGYLPCYELMEIVQMWCHQGPVISL